MNGDEFVKQVQDLHERMVELQQNASLLPLGQQGQMTQALERLSTTLRDLQVRDLQENKIPIKLG